MIKKIVVRWGLSIGVLSALMPVVQPVAVARTVPLSPAPVSVTVGTIVRPPFVMMTAAAPEDTASAQRTVPDSALHGFSFDG